MDADQSSLSAWKEAVRRHEESLQPGVRVRVRLSECREDWGTGGIPDAHPEWANGAVGFIDHMVTPMDGPTEIVAAYTRHPYFVRLDTDGPGGTYGLCLAAAELMPLDTPGDQP